MKSAAKTVKQYLDSLPADRRAAITAVRRVILKNLPKGYQEAMQYGMIGYSVPLKLYPPGYHCKKDEPLPYAALASQKNHMALYLCTVYGDKKTAGWFRKAVMAAGKKLDMGKSCVRFRKIDDLPLDVIGKAIARTSVKDLIKHYEKLQK